MKKVFDQTVRDIKREVNKKVLKIPGAEQKALDATSNEPWGPHGSLLASIAQATRNHHEYQMIMAVIWKRINDTGKNWRHVYKALIVLEYLVAHGAERAIDEINEHAYQISTLSEFQYIDSSGRDQGNNVRRKSQSLVALVKDKERILEVRQKASASRDKFRNTNTGAAYKGGSYSGGGGYDSEFQEGHFGRKSGDENGGGYRSERDYNYNDGDRYGRYSESYSRSEDGGRKSFDDYHGGRNSFDDYGSRRRSSDREKNSSFDDVNISPRGLERKYSEQNIGAPPSYEDAMTGFQSPAHSERNEEISAPSGFGTSPTSQAGSSPKIVSVEAMPTSSQASTVVELPSPSGGHNFDSFDEFDPRAALSVSAPALAAADSTPACAPELDLFGSLSLAIVPSPSESSIASTINSGAHPAFAPSEFNHGATNQPFEDPFGDSPFKAIPSTDAPSNPIHPFYDTNEPAVTHTSKAPDYAPPLPEAVPSLHTGMTPFGPTDPAYNFDPPPANPSFLPQNTSSNHELDILADIIPTPTTHPTATDSHVGYLTQLGPPVSTNSSVQEGSLLPPSSATGFQAPPQAGPWSQGASVFTEPVAVASLSPYPATVPQPIKEKFETKSSVWSDTLSRGLVDLNISGSKTNPLADIGVDFDAINRKEKRTEKQTNAVSTITMGKAMGTGSGTGRGVLSSIRPPPNPVMGSGPGTGLGFGGIPSPGVGSRPAVMGGGPGMIAGFGDVNQHTGFAGTNTGLGLNTGMAQNGSIPTQVPGSYSHLTGAGHPGQQPYGGGYHMH